MEQLVILVIIGLISLVNWALQKSAEKRGAAKATRTERREEKREERRNIYTQPAPGSPQTVRPAPQQRDPFKELMEALGLPVDTPPSLPVPAPQQVIDEEEEFASLEKPEPPPVSPVRIVKSPGRRMPSVRRPDEKEARLASAFAAQEEKTRPWRSPDGSSIRSLLSDRSSQRQAVILAEILGRPRAFLPPDEWTAVPIR